MSRRVDYMKYAQAVGAPGLQIRDADEIAPSLRGAFDIPGPALIEVRLDCRDNAKPLKKCTRERLGNAGGDL